MSECPKVIWDEWSHEDFEWFASQLEKRFRCVLADYPKSPMSFDEFKNKWGKDRAKIVIDESTQIRQKLVGSINPARESLWLKEFEKWLKDKEKK